MTSTNTVPGRSAAALVAVVVVLWALTTGCTSAQPLPEGPVDPRAELMARPSIEEMTARYQQMHARIRAEVDAVIGPRRWRQFQPSSRTPCGFDFPREYDARAFSLEDSGFSANIADDRWPQVEGIVLAVAREYGFTDPAELRINQPGRHQVGAVDRTLGANVSFGTQKVTIMSTSSGCHLPAASRPAS